MSHEKEGVRDSEKFNASHPFPHDLPYREFYAEKVPLLNVFHMVIAYFVASRCQERHLFGKATNTAWGFLGGEKLIAVECGVYKGNSLIACAEIARSFGLPFHFYGLDTFEGLPPLSQKDRDLAPAKAPYLKRRLFIDTSLEEVQKQIQEKGLDPYISLMPGLFTNTLPTLIDKKFWFVSIDCDLYEPHVECLQFFYPRMERGGIIFFDDYHSVEFPMGRTAIDEFLADKSESLVHLRYGKDKPNHTKTFIVKH